MGDQKTNLEMPLSTGDGTEANAGKARLMDDSELEDATSLSTQTDVAEEAEADDTGDEDPSEAEEDEDDPFKTWMAILIAVVTLVGAWMGWRTAEISGIAGDAALGGINAIINAESTLTLNSIGLYTHYRAYTEYTRYQTLSQKLGQEANAEEQAGKLMNRTEADDLAAVQLPFFLSRYLTRDGGYHSQRELGEAWAETEQKMDLDPTPYFEESDFFQLKTNRLIALFIVLSFSLLFYTLAEGLHRERAFWRYSMAILGTVSMIFCIWATLWIDWWMA